MIRAALSGEMRKMWKRPATWVTLALYALITFADLFDEYRDARAAGEPLALPGAWSTILGQGVVIAFVFASVLLILLVAAEFGWRTARQNVIDGLSKTQWYGAKLLLIPFVVALFLGLRVLVGVAVAWPGTDLTIAPAPIGPVQLRAIAGMWLGGMGYASLAVFAAAAIRSSGAAMAVWFAWFAFAERLLAAGLGSLFESTRAGLRWLPIATFSRLNGYVRYDSETFRRAAEWVAEQDGAIPDQVALGPAVAGTLAWIAALAVGGWLWYRRRDL